MRKISCYLADILTFLRFGFVVVILVAAIVGWPAEVALLAFGLGELTDAFDGTCARKFPFPKGKEPKYRRFAVKYDMIADASIWAVMMLYFIVRVNLAFGIMLLVLAGALFCIIELAVYGKFFGHPDDCKSWSLCANNFKLAKKVVMGRRMFYLLTIAVVIVWTLFATSWDTTMKITLLIVAAVIGIFLWFFLEQRRKNISRDAVELEKKMLKKSNGSKK